MPYDMVMNPLSFRIENDFVQVYTNGYFVEDGRAGMGVWWGYQHFLNVSERVPGLV